MFCEYGCGNLAVKKLKNGKICCSNSANSCPELKKRNSLGLKNSYKKGKKVNVGFNDETRRKSIEVRINNLKKKPFELWGRKLQEKLILHEQNYCCLHCSLKEWMGKPLILELDHVDGNRNNNKRENLRLLCPNCHSQTDTWRGRNINSGKLKVSDEDILNELKKRKNIRQVLIHFNLAPKGGNYTRIKKLSARLETVDVEPFKVGEA